MRHRPKIAAAPNDEDGSHPGLHGLSLPPGTLRHLLAALKRQWKRYRRGLKRCQRRFSTKAVHESRVETRRLLSMLELLGPFLVRGRLEKACGALKQHLDLFDDLRDTQVQLAAMKAPARKFAAAAQFQRYLRKREERFAERSRRNVRRIKTRRLCNLVSCCRRDARAHAGRCRPARQNGMLLKTMDNAFRRTLRLKKQIDPARTESIHRTRVAFKKFRYMVETLAGQLPLATDPLLEAMHGYQTSMGEIQDAEVLLRSFDKFAKKKNLPPRESSRFYQDLLRRRQQLIAGYLRKSDQLLEFWPHPVAWNNGQVSNGPLPSPGVLRSLHDPARRPSGPHAAKQTQT